ncbi:MAG: hypothetical protein U1F36_10990 [Planctomycetota bacterium]
MVKNSLQEAQNAAQTRRGQSGTWTGGATANLTLALQIAYTDQGAREGMNTVSVALLTSARGERVAWYASQDGKDVARPQALQGCTWVNASIPGHTGLHAEMALVRGLYEKGLLQKGQEAQQAATLDLVIVCCNANVCADCSGWMHSHGIPHCPALAVPKTSANWIHPRTGAFFNGGKTVNSYAKVGDQGVFNLGGIPSGRGGAMTHL